MATTIPGFLPVMLLYLLVMLAIGWWASRYQTSGSEYYAGSSNVHWVVIAFTYVATIQSGWGFIGQAGMAYSGGVSTPWIIRAAFVPSIAITMFLIGRRMRYLTTKYGCITLPDVYETIYGSKVLRAISAVVIALGFTFYMVSQNIAMARSLEIFLGMPYQIGLATGVVVVAVYSIMGGARAVVTTDFLQGIVMLIGSIAIIVAVLTLSGGMSGLVQPLSAGVQSGALPANYLQLGSQPWFMVSCFMLFVLGGMSSPHSVNRFFMINDARFVMRAGVAGVIMYAVYSFTELSGLFMRGQVLSGAIPALASPDHALLLFISNYMHPVLGILIGAAVVAGIMSTADSMLLVIGSSFGRDIYQKLINPNITARQEVLVGRWASTIAVAISYLFSVWNPGFVALLGLAAWGFLAAAFTWASLGGLYWKRASAQAAIASIVVGVVLAVLFRFVKLPRLDPGAWAMLFSLATFIILSYLMPAKRTATLDRDTLVDEMSAHRASARAPVAKAG